MYRDALIRNTYQAMVVYDGESTTLTSDHPAYHDVSHDEILARRVQQQRYLYPTQINNNNTTGVNNNANDVHQPNSIDELTSATAEQSKKRQPYRPPHGGYSLKSVLNSQAGQSPIHGGHGTSSNGQSGTRRGGEGITFHTTFTTSNNVVSTPTAQLLPASNRSLNTMTPMSGVAMSDGLTQLRQFSTTTPHSFDDNNSIHTSLNYNFVLPPANDGDSDGNEGGHDDSWLEYNDDDEDEDAGFNDLIAEAVQRNIERSKGGSKPTFHATGSMNHQPPPSKAVYQPVANAPAEGSRGGGGGKGPSRGRGGQQRRGGGGRKGGGGRAPFPPTASGSATNGGAANSNVTGRFDVLVKH